MNKYITNVIKLMLITAITAVSFYANHAKGQRAYAVESSIIPMIDPGRVSTDYVEKEPELLQSQAPIQLSQPASKSVKESLNTVKFKLTDLVVTGSTLYSKEQLLPLYKSFLNKNISLNDLNSIAASITAYYRNNGYVLCRAILPPQEITQGKVKIKIIEGYISDIQIEGEIGKVRARIAGYGVKIKNMRPLQVKELERYLLLLNDIPGLEVKTVLSPSVTIPGATELTIVANQKKFNTVAYLNNHGSRYLGPYQFLASVSMRDAILAADSISLQTVATPNSDELRQLGLQYGVPLGLSGLNMNIGGNFTETKPGFVISKHGFVGRSKNWALGVDYPLVRNRASKLSIYSKFDWLDTYTNYNYDPRLKRINNKIFQDHIRSVRFGLSYDLNDQLKGNNIFNIELSKGMHIFGASPQHPGKPFKNSQPSGTPLSRENGNSDYKKMNINISRYQSLGHNAMLVLTASGQRSFNDTLLSAEEFSFGGVRFGNAYDPAEIIGDSGVAGKIELRIDEFFNSRIIQKNQYYAFYELGAIWNVHAGPQPRKDSGADIGIGIRTNLNKYFYFNLELAKPLTRAVNSQQIINKYGKPVRALFQVGIGL